MDNFDKQKILQNLNSLSQSTRNTNCLLDLLVKKEVLGHEEVEFLRKSRSMYEKNSDLYRLLMKKGPTAFPLLLECLSECGNENAIHVLQGQQQYSNSKSNVQIKLSDKSKKEETALKCIETNKDVRIISTLPNVIVPWKVSLQKVQENQQIGPIATNVLIVLSFVTTEIDIEILSQIMKAFSHSVTQSSTTATAATNSNSNFDDCLNEIVKLLETNSLLGVLPDRKSLTMEKSLKDFILDEFTDDKQRMNIIDVLLQFFSTQLSSTKIEMPTLKFVDDLWQQAEKDKNLVEKYHQLPEILFDRYYSDKKQFTFEAFAFSCSALNTFFKYFGEESKQSLRMSYNMGRALVGIGDFEQAARILKDTYKKQLNVLGKEHEFCLYTAIELGDLFKLMEQYEKSLKWYNLAFNRAKIIDSTDNQQQLLQIQIKLAEVFTKLGKFAMAKVIYEQVREKQNSLLGTSHPDTLTTIAAIEKLQLIQTFVVIE